MHGFSSIFHARFHRKNERNPVHSFYGLVHSFLRRCWFISKVLRLFRKIFAFFASYSAIIFDGLALGWYHDKAKALASGQNSIVMCREIAMPKATEAEERDKYQGEAIISLLNELKNVLANSVCTKISLFTTAEGIKLLMDLARLYESVFSDGRCGVAHSHIGRLYLYAAVFDARQNHTETALEYFKKGFEHIKLYQSIRCTGISIFFSARS